MALDVRFLLILLLILYSLLSLFFVLYLYIIPVRDLKASVLLPKNYWGCAQNSDTTDLMNDRNLYHFRIEWLYVLLMHVLSFV